MAVLSLGLYAENNAFSHLDISLTAGTDGIGLDFSTPINSWLGIRGGFSFIPSVTAEKAMSLNDSTLVNGAAVNKFDDISEVFGELTGYELKDRIMMCGQTEFYNGRLMFDFRPFNNKNWYLTAGCWFGNSQIASVKNAPESMPTLLAIGTYNHYANKLLDPEVMAGNTPFISFNDLELYIDYDEIFVQYGEFDIYKQSELIEKMRTHGPLGGIMGKKDGETYRLSPDEQGLMRATVEVNAVKPYVGFGYEGPISKKSDKYLIGFDCGVLFWGGVPHFYTHDGSDLTYEVTDYNAQIDGYCRALKALPVYPVAHLRLIRRIDFNK